ncbi:MAG TPA: MOSC domain-containing protein [Nitrospiraceae bacterium]|nr:MOSC domain-containing protein [Nitrospiraceae bacterium]
MKPGGTTPNSQAGYGMDREVDRSDAIGAGRLHQINISDGGVPKLPVAEAMITVDGVSGDRQRNRSVHGGRDRALCLFSLERIESLRQEGHTIYPGASGENLTLVGLNWSAVRPGDRLRIGETVELELTSYTTPCRYNAHWFLGGDYGRISHKRHPGWSRLYAKVLREGLVRQGDRVDLVEKAKVKAEAERNDSGSATVQREF